MATSPAPTSPGAHCDTGGEEKEQMVNKTMFIRKKNEKMQWERDGEGGRRLHSVLLLMVLAPRGEEQLLLSCDAAALPLNVAHHVDQKARSKALWTGDCLVPVLEPQELHFGPVANKCQVSNGDKNKKCPFPCPP